MIQPQDPPPPPPEAVLLSLVREAMHLSLRAAASRAGIGKTWLAQIEKGSQRRPDGTWDTVIASDRDLAHIARAYGIEPARIEEAGRPRAALVLKEIIRREQAGPQEQLPPVPAEIRAIAEQWHVDPEELWADPDARRAWESPSIDIVTRTTVQGIAASRLAARRRPGAGGEEGYRRRALCTGPTPQRTPAAAPRPRTPEGPAAGSGREPAPEPERQRGEPLQRVFLPAPARAASLR